MRVPAPPAGHAHIVKAFQGRAEHGMRMSPSFPKDPKAWSLAFLFFVGDSALLDLLPGLTPPSHPILFLLAGAP